MLKNATAGVKTAESLSYLKAEFGRFLWRIGVSANFVTILGLILAFFSGVLIYFGDLFSGAYMLLLSGMFDLFDGAIARASGAGNKFGAILDSTLDRYGDGFVLAGLLFYCARTGRMFYALLAFSALMGSFAISYVRARAECLVDKCRVGYWERGERIALICIGLFLKNPAMVLWILAFATHWTAFQRLLYSATRFQGVKPVPGGSLAALVIKPCLRISPRYYAKCALLLVALLFKPFF